MSKALDNAGLQDSLPGFSLSTAKAISLYSPKSLGNLDVACTKGPYPLDGLVISKLPSHWAVPDGTSRAGLFRRSGLPKNTEIGRGVSNFGIIDWWVLQVRTFGPSYPQY